MYEFVNRKVGKKLYEIKTMGLFWTLRKYVRDHIYSHKRHVFMYRDLADPHRMYSRARRWSFGMVEKDEDLERFRENFSSRMDYIKSMHDQGVVGGMAFYDDVLVGYTWWVTKDYFEPEYNFVIRPKEKEIYQFAGYLLPKLRGTPIVLDGMKFGQQYFRDRGYLRTTCHVDTELVPILKLHFKLGFKEGGSVLHIRKLLFYRWSTVENYEGERYGEFNPKRPVGVAAPPEGREVSDSAQAGTSPG